MSKHEEVELKTEKFCQPICEAEGVSLYDVEFVKEADTYVLRVTIDKESGVDIINCENVSRKLSEILDEKDYISEAYTLEVTSPGLGRPLKKEKDYQRNLGKEIEVRTYKPKDGEKEFVGTLLSFDETGFVLKTEEKEITFTKKEVSLIREYVDWDAV